MPLIESESGAAGRSPKDNDRFDPKPVRTPRPAGRPAPGPSFRAPARDAASRFDRTGVTKLTPFVMPAPARTAPPPVTSEPWKPESTSSSARQRVEIPDFFDKDSDYRRKRDEVMRVENEAQVERKPTVRRSYRMTWEDYNKLSDAQRAAVDFNTMLVQAREKDLNAEYTKVSPEERAAYDEAVQDMFGEQRGSETYAPETVAVLKQIDFQSTDEDLDDFLGLKATISEKELADFDFKSEKVTLPIPAGLSAVTPVDEVKLDLSTTEQALAKGTARLQETLAKGNELLHNFKASAAASRNPDVLAFGGTFNEVGRPPGWGPVPADPNEGNIHSFFQETFTNLALKGSDIEGTWSTVERVLKPEEKVKLMEYLDARSRSAAEYGLDFADEGTRSPEEFRKMLGLDRAGD